MVARGPGGSLDGGRQMAAKWPCPLTEVSVAVAVIFVVPLASARVLPARKAFATRNQVRRAISWNYEGGPSHGQVERAERRARTSWSVG